MTPKLEYICILMQHFQVKLFVTMPMLLSPSSTGVDPWPLWIFHESWVYGYSIGHPLCTKTQSPGCRLHAGKSRSVILCNCNAAYLRWRHWLTCSSLCAAPCRRCVCTAWPRACRCTVGCWMWWRGIWPLLRRSLTSELTSRTCCQRCRGWVSISSP